MHSLRQLIFGLDIVIPIKHTVDWELMRQQNQIQTNKANTHENSKIFDHDYKV